MKASKNIIKLIKEFEGYKPYSYLCPAGVWTIGYGTTKGISRGMVVNEQQAEQMLREDLQVFEQGVERAVKVDLTQNQFDALVSFSYNVGLGALERSTLLRLLNAGDYKGAANELPRWNKAGGKTLAGLTRRRLAEQRIFLK